MTQRSGLKDLGFIRIPLSRIVVFMFRTMLSGKVAIVTGAAQGLGKAFSKTLVQRGVKVSNMYRVKFLILTFVCVCGGGGVVLS